MCVYVCHSSHEKGGWCGGGIGVVLCVTDILELEVEFGASQLRVGGADRLEVVMGQGLLDIDTLVRVEAQHLRHEVQGLRDMP